MYCSKCNTLLESHYKGKSTICRDCNYKIANSHKNTRKVRGDRVSSDNVSNVHVSTVCAKSKCNNGHVKCEKIEPICCHVTETNNHECCTEPDCGLRDNDCFSMLELCGNRGLKYP